jgi:hypothetical protein
MNKELNGKPAQMPFALPESEFRYSPTISRTSFKNSENQKFPVLGPADVEPLITNASDFVAPMHGTNSGFFFFAIPVGLIQSIQVNVARARAA